MSASRRWSLASLAALALGSAATCVPLVEYDDRPCPCSSGYRCCAAVDLCLADDDFDRLCAPVTSGGSGNGGLAGATPGTSGGSPSTGDAGSGGQAAGGSSAAGGSGAEGPGQGEAAGAGGAGPVEQPSCSAYPRKANVLLLAYDPILEVQAPGVSLQDYHDVADFRALSATLAQQLSAASGGVINFHIVEQRELNAWPPQLPDAPPLDESTFFETPVEEAPLRHADYEAIFADQNLCQLVQDKDISEIWLWGSYDVGGSFGFDEWKYRLASGLAGNPSQADRDFYEARALGLPDCGRSLWVMGFFYRLEAVWAHRVFNERAGQVIQIALRSESAMPEVGQAIWTHFSRYGGEEASIGEPWFPPNTVAIGAYGSKQYVSSDANLWYDYPQMAGAPQLINCDDWNCSDVGFQSWYSFHIPRASGMAPGGTCNNWWKYAADPDGTLEPCSGNGCRPNLENGLPCAADSDCASGHCACDATSKTATICVAQPGASCLNPNWALCESDADCQTGVCGCSNGGPPPERCLPSSDYDYPCASPAQGGQGGTSP